MTVHVTPMPSRQVYALVARVRFETSVVSFTAAAKLDGQPLKDLAVDRATNLPEHQWRPADCADGSQHPFVVSVATEHAPANEASPAAFRKACDRFGSYRFLLLQVDIDNGEGEVVLLPWINTSDLLFADLAKDWIAALQELLPTEFSELNDEAI